MKIPKTVSKILENKYVLYFVLFLAAFTLFGYLIVGNIKAIAVFILIGYLVFCFNKNMILVFAIPLILTSILEAGKFVKEGLENATDASTTTSTEKDKKDVVVKIPEPVKIPGITEKTVTTAIPTEVAPVSSDEKMTNMGKKNNRIDYASTVEDAYDDLNKVLGGDGIKRLTDDTQKLMGQQMKLAEAMKSMTPLMTQAKELMKGFDMKGMGDITSMAKQFGISK
jgi:hypothetical protein